MSYKNKIYHELYDHKYDSDENNNVASDESYIQIKDSKIILLILKLEKPDGLGRQIQNAKPNFGQNIFFQNQDYSSLSVNFNGISTFCSKNLH